MDKHHSKYQITQLSAGEEYSIELYPKDEVVKAKYIGQGKLEGFGNQHLFISEGKDKNYIAMNDYWLRKKDDGILTYAPISSFSTLRINKSGLGEMLDSENVHYKNLGLRIIRFLENFGEKFD